MIRATGTAALMSFLHVVDGLGDIRELRLARKRDLRPDQQFFGTDVERLHVDERLDLGVRVDRGADLLDVVRFALADEQARHLRAEDDRHQDQQRADEQGADRIPDRIAGQHRQADAERRRR